MKTKLISIEKYLLLVDLDDYMEENIWDKIKIGENFVLKEQLQFPTKTKYSLDILHPKETGYEPTGFKIIGHLLKENNPILKDINLLPELPSNEEDVERMACKYGNIDYPMPYGYVGAANAFLNGYKATKQSDKKYSEKDIEAAIDYGYSLTELQGVNGVGGLNGYYQRRNDFIESLNKTKEPTGFEVEVDIIEYKSEINCDSWKSIPKVINGTLQGKYVY